MVVLMLKFSAFLCCLISVILIENLSQVHGTPQHKKHSLLTIKTQNGQIYDCVDFYKQPTLQDRRFINHIHQVNITTLQSQAWKVNGLRLKDGCPLGTVPILRSYNISKSSTNIDSIAGKNCIAAIRTSGNRDSFYGASGSVSVYQQLVYGNQRSNSRMRLKDSTDFIEAGWMVNPSLYKDSEAHFYARFSSKTAGGCFNLLCPGFVQVSKDVPLGIIPDRYSKIGEDNQYTLLITIEKHQDDGHWWLSINSNKEAIGYWPKTLFAGSLKEIAFQIEWGGEVDNPESDKTPEPYMGSGLSARDSTKLSAFYCQIQAARRLSQYDNNPKPTEKFQECDSDGYKTYDVDYRGDPWGRLIFFGGPYATMS